MRLKGFRCFECNALADHAHHIVPYSMGGTRTVPLCETCHAKVHGMNFEEHSKRVREGMQRARERGKVLGRPRTSVLTDEVFRLNNEGLSQSEIARSVGTSQSTVSRILSGVRK